MKSAVKIQGLLFGLTLTQDFNRVLVPAFACFQIGERVKVAGKTSITVNDGENEAVNPVSMELDGSVHVVNEDDMIKYGCIVENYDFHGVLVSRFAYGDGVHVIVLDSEYMTKVVMADDRQNSTAQFVEDVKSANKIKLAERKAALLMQAANEKKAIENMSKAIEMAESAQKAVILFLESKQGQAFNSSQIQAKAGLFSMTVGELQKGLNAMAEAGAILQADGKFSAKPKQVKTKRPRI